MFTELTEAKRIIVKVGTSTLAYHTGGLNLRRIEELVKVLSDIKNMGREVVLVTSGAIGVGASCMGLKERPRETIEKQAAAAVGQCELMNMYANMFALFNHRVAQILMTKDVVDHETSKTNVINTFSKLLDYGVIPIVNENDCISTEQAEFGDNDTLSAVVARLVKGDLLVILTDIDGLYDSNPQENPNAKLIPYVDDISKIKGFAKGAGTKLGTGGMVTKLRAAEIASEDNIPTVIASGTNPSLLYDIIEGEFRGTLIKEVK